ncbi:MAG: dethiobiotin synthetase [Granulosicoccus sp.]
MSRNFFISGNGTDVGKTVVSACLVHALKADYWKPIQAGDLEFGDAERVKSLAASNCREFHSTTYGLTKPMSPHAAAEIDGVEIQLDQIQIPETDNDLIIEGAGGLLVPLNEQQTIISLVGHLNVPLILVCGTYLGSINHSLLSISEAERNGIEIAGLVFFGEQNEESERIILKMSGAKKLGGVYPQGKITSENIHLHSQQFHSL